MVRLIYLGRYWWGCSYWGIAPRFKKDSFNEVIAVTVKHYPNVLSCA
jgi:hypothetical protein